MSEDIDARIDALRAEAKPLRVRLSEIGVEIERLRHERNEAARVARTSELFRAQADEVAAAWAAYVAGDREDILVSTDEGPQPVTPFARLGVWVVHENHGSGSLWTVTLGPIGVLAVRRWDSTEATAIARRLHAATPADFDPATVAPPNARAPQWMADAVRGEP